jgi:hypothetical protein
MSRYLSNQEIKKNERALTEDNLLDASKFRSQLKDAINNENFRTNVDSAKKRAVLQGMNYDGFHQMVLGANLKGLKTKELQDFKPNNVIMNTVVTKNLLTKESDFLANNFVKENENEIVKDEIFKTVNIIEQNDTNKLKEYLRNFKKQFKSEKVINSKINLLLKFENFDLVINSDIIDSDFFLDLISTISNYFLSESKYISEEIKIDLLKLLDIVLNHSSFPGLKKFIGKKHKANFTQLLEEREEKYFSEISTKDYYEKLAEIILK